MGAGKESRVGLWTNFHEQVNRLGGSGRWGKGEGEEVGSSIRLAHVPIQTTIRVQLTAEGLHGGTQVNPCGHCRIRIYLFRNPQVQDAQLKTLKFPPNWALPIPAVVHHTAHRCSHLCTVLCVCPSWARWTALAHGFLDLQSLVLITLCTTSLKQILLSCILISSKLMSPY